MGFLDFFRHKVTTEHVGGDKDGIVTEIDQNYPEGRIIITTLSSGRATWKIAGTGIMGSADSTKKAQADALQELHHPRISLDIKF